MKVVPGIRGKDGLSIVATKWSLPGKGGSTADPPPSRTSRDSRDSSSRVLRCFRAALPFIACPFSNRTLLPQAISRPDAREYPAATAQGILGAEFRLTAERGIFS